METEVVMQDYAELREVAKAVLPAGNFGNVASEMIIRNGRGARIWDEDGNEYIDFMLGSGPMLLGHNYPDVDKAVIDQISQGTTFFMNNRPGIKLAEAIRDAVPCAQKVRFVSTGSEADAYAMRLVRAYTGKNKILKFEGAYHGMSDYGLMSLTPKKNLEFPMPEPDSAGIPESVRDEMLVAPYNDIEFFSKLVHQYKDELAGVIIEPMQRILPPEPGFLEGVRKITKELGIPLIFDEVVTGFRLAYGGAQEFYGVIPDICTLGKACGGGYPLAAIAGTDEIMACFDKSLVGEDRFLFQTGTLSGNPVASAAGLATLEALKKPGVYEAFFKKGQELIDLINQQLKIGNLPGRVVGLPPMFEVIFKDGPITNYREVQSADPWLAKRFNQLQRERGILKGDTKYYVCMALTDEEMAFTKKALQSALEQLDIEYRARLKS